MRIVRDHREVPVRITDERLAHVLDHPEMVGLEGAIEETLRNPERVVVSVPDPQALLYYRFYPGTRVGDKYLCVVVKFHQDAFLLTAYLTDKVKRGVQLWPRDE
ncbi:MAG: hypothetical protein AAB328_08885 [candidate division NC10 bacterium]|nr:MAG: hypothetical protein A2X50_16520 [Candidatus Rokubacteria bacterium GWF2_70_14]